MRGGNAEGVGEAGPPGRAAYAYFDAKGLAGKVAHRKVLWAAVAGIVAGGIFRGLRQAGEGEEDKSSKPLGLKDWGHVGGWMLGNRGTQDGPEVGRRQSSGWSGPSMGFIWQAWVP